jgi:hypothetical protein
MLCGVTCWLWGFGGGVGGCSKLAGLSRYALLLKGGSECCLLEDKSSGLTKFDAA